MSKQDTTPHCAGCGKPIERGQTFFSRNGLDFHSGCGNPLGLKGTQTIADLRARVAELEVGLRQVVEAIERGSTTAPVAECARALLNAGEAPGPVQEPAMSEQQPIETWNSALEAAAKTAIDNGDLMGIHGPRIASAILALRNNCSHCEVAEHAVLARNEALSVELLKQAALLRHQASTATAGIARTLIETAERWEALCTQDQIKTKVTGKRG